MATITLTVTVSNPGSGNKYYIDGALQATVSMIPGNTYKFDQADNSNSGHPLRLSTTSNGSHNSGSEYTTGVTTSGTPGSSGAYTQIEVTVLTVQSLYYYCTSHSGMGGAINVGNSSTLGLKEMSGFPIQNLTADPVPYAQEISNNPYGGTWASGGNLNNSRQQLTGTGIQTAALAIGGYDGSNRGYTENYNGSSWTEVADLNSVRRNSGSSGTTTAALAFGGFTVPPASNGPSALNEQWDGSSWTETADLNTERFGMGSVGTTTASLASGGITTAQVAVNESWNGSAWTEVGDLNTARGLLGSMGTSTAGLVAGGGPAPAVSNAGVTESWNGSSWTEVADLNVGGETLGSAGTQTSGLVFGGVIFPPAGLTAKTESWDGSSWTEVNDLSLDRQYGARAGASNSSALYAGGNSPGDSVATTEEWAFTGLPPSTPAVGYSDAIVGQMYYNSTSGSFKAIKNGGAPIGSWASGGSMNTARGYIGSAGNKSALLAFGSNSYSGVTESYNGSTWTEVNDLNTGRNFGASGGSQTAAFMAGGRISSTDSTVVSEEWNGSSWAEGNDLNLERYSLTTGMGSQTAGLAVGGNKRFSPSASPNYFAGTEEYNGTSWSEVNDLPTALESAGGIGTQTAAGQWGGYNGSYITQGFLYDGTSWSSTTNFPAVGGNFSSSGTTTTGLIFGIYFNGPGSGVANNLSWDGTSFTEVGDLATARTGGGGPTASLGTASSAILAGGNASPYTTATEEWSAADFEIKTLTTS